MEKHSTSQKICIQGRSSNDLGWALQQALDEYMERNDILPEYAHIGITLHECTYIGEQINDWLFTFSVWNKI